MRPSLRPDVSSYAKGRARYTAYDEKHLKRFRHKDSDGRRWTDDNLTAKGLQGGGYEYKGWRSLWRVPTTTMERLDREHRLHFTRKGGIHLKRYLDELPGHPVQALWDDIEPSRARHRLHGVRVDVRQRAVPGAGPPHPEERGRLERAGEPGAALRPVQSHEGEHADADRTALRTKAKAMNGRAPGTRRVRWPQSTHVIEEGRGQVYTRRVVSLIKAVARGRPVHRPAAPER